MIKIGYLTHENGEWVAHSESGRVFGRYKSKEDAKKRLRQMEMFKHMKKTAAGPKLKNFFASEPSCIVHGSAKKCDPSFSKKAEVVFEKLAIDVINPKTAKIIDDFLRKHLVNSYAKNKGKENIFVHLKNMAAKDIKDIFHPSVAERQKLMKDVVKGTKDNFKNFFKGK